MKLRLIGLFCLTGILSMTGCRQEGFRFRLEAHLADSCGIYYLTPIDDPSHYYLKSQTDEHGRLVMKGRLREPVCADLRNGLGEVVSLVFLEEGTIRIEPLPNDVTHLQVSGTPSNDACNLFAADVDELFAHYASMKDITEELQKKFTQELDSMQRAFLDNNKDKILGIYLFVNEWINTMDTTEIERTIAEFTPEMQANSLMDAVRNRLDTMKKSEGKGEMK